MGQSELLHITLTHSRGRGGGRGGGGGGGGNRPKIVNTDIGAALVNLSRSGSLEII